MAGFDLQIVSTADNSHTLFLPGLNEHYHSVSGAVTESRHIFIEAGLDEALKNKDAISVLEIGFGTGLNALLTCLRAIASGVIIYFEALEPRPIPEHVIEKLNYPEVVVNPDALKMFRKIHDSTWDSEITIHPSFTLFKRCEKLENTSFANQFDLIYFDAFAPQIIPHLWSEEIFRKLNASLNPNGMLVTYSAAGMVKSNLRNAGFCVKRLPGANGKRHMIRAVKI